MKIFDIKKAVGEKLNIKPANLNDIGLPSAENPDLVFELCGKYIEFKGKNSNPENDPKTFHFAEYYYVKNGWRLPTVDEMQELCIGYDAYYTVDSVKFDNRLELVSDGESVDGDKFNFYVVYWLDDYYFWTCQLNSNLKYKIAKSRDRSEDRASVRLCREVRRPGNINNKIR